MKRITYILCGLLCSILLVHNTAAEVKAVEEETGVTFYHDDEDGEASGGEDSGDGEEEGSGTEGGSGGITDPEGGTGSGSGTGSRTGGDTGTDRTAGAQGTANQPGRNFSGNKLPQTGEAGTWNYRIYGMLLLMFVFLKIRLYRKEDRRRAIACVAAGLSVVTIAGNPMAVNAAIVSSHGSQAEVEFKAGDEEGLFPTDPDYPEDLEEVDPRPEDPEDPGPRPIGQDGLYLLITPKLDFGAVKISKRDASYSAKAQYLYRVNHDDYIFRPNYLEVADLRGNNAGWTVTVTKTEQFTCAEGMSLDGARIVLRNGWVNSAMENWEDSEVMVFQDIILQPNETQVVMHAETGSGAGRWYGLFGTTEGLRDKNSDGKNLTEVIDNVEVEMLFNPSITLEVPGGTEKHEKAYSTTLLWTVSDTP